MLRVCPGPNVVKGIDIYHGDPVSSFSAIKGSGVEFAFLKAWEYHLDPTFERRWPKLRQAQILRGAYTFFHPSLNAVVQANKFAEVVGELLPDDLPPVLDWEVTDEIPAASDRAAGLQWLQRVEELTGKIPLIYGSVDFLRSLDLGPEFKRYALWIAAPDVKCPRVPSPWTTWTFWQNSWTGATPGVSGHVDQDLFNGSLEELQNFIRASTL